VKNNFLLEILLVFLLAVTLNGQEAPVPSVSSQKPLQELLVQALQSYRTGKFDAALEKYQAALQQDPKSGEAYAGLARTYLKQENVQTALETAKKGVGEAPDSLTAHTALGEVYFRQGKMEECEKEFLKAVNTIHPEARAYLGLARINSAFSLYAKAEKQLERAHALDPNDPDIQRWWMQTLSRSERIQSLQSYLAGATDDDEETREGMRHYLELLKERQEHPEKSCKLATKLASTEAVLEPMLIDATHLHGYGLEVKVNGQSSRLLLDTGASGLLINSKIAERAGVKQVVSDKILGIGDKGVVEGYLGYADSIKIGNLEFQNCLVEVSEKRSVIGDDGIIGADVFSHYLVTLDFPDKKLKLQELPKRADEKETAATLSTNAGYDDDEEEESAAPAERSNQKTDATAPATADRKATPRPVPHDRYIAPEMQDYSKVFRFGHDLLIPTKVGDADYKLFLIDTGSFLNYISPDAAREVTKVRSEHDTRIRGLNGSVKEVYNADKAVLQFSHYRQENQDILGFDFSGISKHTGTEVSGILGFVTLRFMVVRIDYRDGLVDFYYDKNRWHSATKAFSASY